MLISFIGSQARLTDFQQKYFVEILQRKECTELITGDCIGAEDDALELALQNGIKNISIYPCDNPTKRAFRLDPTQITRRLSVPLDWISIGDVKVRFFPCAPYQKSKEQIIDSGALVIAAPKEFKMTFQSACWRSIRYAWKVKKDSIIIIPPVERPNTGANESELDKE